MKPNIIYIMADDMGYGDVGCFNPESKIPTPNMDRLAQEGMRFTDAHSSSAVCTPSRYSVLAGRYCWRTRHKSGVHGGFSLPLIDPARTTLASMLQQNGYHTAAVGKWHVGFEWQAKDGERIDYDCWQDEGHVDYTKPIINGPLDVGFDYFFGISGSLDMPPYCHIENRHTVGIPNVEKDVYNPQQKKGFMTPGWKDEDVDIHHCRKTVDWLEKHAAEKPDQPFFLYLTPSSPHRPCMAPDITKGKSQAGPRGDMVCVVDWMVGEITKTIEKLGYKEDTLIIVTSDNGANEADVDGNTYGHKSCGDWRGFKAQIYDGGHREPFIARWPGIIKPGSVCDATIGLMDLMATCADIVDTDLPENVAEDSFSFLDYLKGETASPKARDTVVHHSVSGVFAVRQGPWKMILGQGNGAWGHFDREIDPSIPVGQLYHMEKDPQETTNLWEKEPAIVERLTALLQKYKDENRSRFAEKRVNV